MNAELLLTYYNEYHMSKHKLFAGYSDIIQSIVLLKYDIPENTADAYFESQFRINKYDSYIRKWIDQHLYNEYIFHRHPRSYDMPNGCITWYDKFYIITTVYTMPSWSTKLLRALMPDEYKVQIKKIDNVIELLADKKVYFNKIINKFSKYDE